MRRQKEAGFSGTVAWKPRHHIGTAGKNLPKRNLRPKPGEQLLQIEGKRGFARFGNTGIPLRIDTRDPDQLPEQWNRGESLHQSTLPAWSSRYQATNFGIPSRIGVRGA